MKLCELRGPVLASDATKVVRLANRVFDALCAILKRREHTVGVADKELGIVKLKQTTITSEQIAQRLGIDLPKFKVAIFGAYNRSAGAGTTGLGHIMLFGSVWDIIGDPMQRSFFVHEFRHIWDIAHGNLDPASYESETQGRTAYENHPAEIDAHFAQLIAPISEFLEIIEQPGVDFRTIVNRRSRLLGRDLRDFFMRAMKRSAYGLLGRYRGQIFVWFHSMTKANRHNVIIRLAAIYRDAVQKSEAAMATARR